MKDELQTCSRKRHCSEDDSGCHHGEHKGKGRHHCSNHDEKKHHKHGEHHGKMHHGMKRHGHCGHKTNEENTSEIE